MKTIKYFLLSSVLVFYGAHAGAAPDVSQLSFSPKAPWATHIDNYEEAGSMHQVCTLGTSFNNGFDLRIRGAQDWVQSINIDFKQDIFEPSKIYQINLSIPGFYKETLLNAKAVSEQDLNIDISDNKDFYKHLRGSAVLDFNLDDNAFRFVMVGLSGEADIFEKCLTQSRVVASANRSAAPVVYDDKAHILEPVSNEEKRARILGHDARVESDDDMPLMTLKRSGRKRFTETISSEIRQNPNIVDDNQAVGLNALEKLKAVSVDDDAVRTKRNRRQVRYVEPVNTKEREASTRSLTSMSSSAPYDYDHHKDATHGVSGRAVNTQNSASGKPIDLAMPPGFDELP